MRILIMQSDKWMHVNNKENAQRQNFDQKIKRYIGNTGNLMFLNGCKYICESEENEYEFYDEYAMHNDMDKYKQMVNEKFDLVIYPLANILQENTVFMKDVIALLRGIKIPIYCMGIGISWNKYENLQELCNHIKEPLKELIDIVDKSGGKFACRGYITQEVIESEWGSGGAGRVIATGCPSMYQNGLIHVEKAMVSKEDFKVAINGRIRDFRDALIRRTFEEYHAVYVDQDEYCSILYGENNRNIKQMIGKLSFEGIKLLSQKQVQFFYQLPVWYQYICDNVDFMFGSRIHGNLIALLAEKPAMVYLPPQRTDLRVKELAEFFKIPSVNTKAEKDLYDLYQEVDYKDFNSNYTKKFTEYETFLCSAGILKKLSRDKNSLFYKTKCDTENVTIDYKKLEEDFSHLGWLYTGWHKLKERKIK